MQAYLDAEKASCPVHRGFASAGDWQLPAARRMPQVRLSRFGGDPPGAPFVLETLAADPRACRQAPRTISRPAGLFLPLAPMCGTVLVSRARLLLPRTTAAVAGPWALAIPPSAPPRRGPRLGDGSVPVTIAGRIPSISVRARASLISMVGRLDLGASPPPLPVCVWLSRHPEPDSAA